MYNDTGRPDGMRPTDYGLLQRQRVEDAEIKLQREGAASAYAYMQQFGGVALYPSRLQQAVASFIVQARRPRPPAEAIAAVTQELVAAAQSTGKKLADHYRQALQRMDEEPECNWQPELEALERVKLNAAGQAGASEVRYDFATMMRYGAHVSYDATTGNAEVTDVPSSQPYNPERHRRPETQQEQLLRAGKRLRYNAATGNYDVISKE